MKKTLTLLMALVLVFSCCLMPSARAADDGIRVRVNGALVDFPDQGPVIDANSRTLVPVRFATEALGAKVNWDGSTKTATISKNGIDVAIVIGERDITVTKGGKSSVVAMDTNAVLLNNRTMVPIRFIAEALGAYVDYSDRHRVVGIYQGELTAEQIATLQQYDMTFDSNSISSIDHTTILDKRNTGSWADMREDLYAYRNAKGTKYYNDLKKHLPAATSAEYYANIIANAKAAIEYHSDNLDVVFAADPSCIYQQFDGYALELSVRGYVTVTPKINVNYMTGGERFLTISLLHMPETMVGKVYTFPIDAHVINLYDGAQLHEVARLDGVDNRIKK